MLEAAGEISGRAKATGEGDIRQRWLSTSGCHSLRHHCQGPLQTDAPDELVQRFTDEQTEDAMEMEGRKAGGPGDNLKGQRLIEVLEDERNGPINPLEVIGCLALVF